MVDLAGPDPILLDEVVRQFLKASRDPARSSPTSKPLTSVVPLKQRSLVPDKNQLLGATHFDAWLRR